MEDNKAKLLQEEVAILSSLVKERVGGEALWCSLAEECSELSKASLKVARFLHGTNPPFIDGHEVDEDDMMDLVRNVIEEFTDVMAVSMMLNIGGDMQFMAKKLRRWCKRLGIDWKGMIEGVRGEAAVHEDGSD